MPDYQCKDCDCTFDIPAKAHRLEYTCPDCHSDRWALIRRTANLPHVRGDLLDWSNENGGKGRRISQMDHDIGKPYYAKNQRQIFEDGDRRGLTVIKA